MGTIVVNMEYSIFIDNSILTTFSFIFSTTPLLL